MASLRVVAYMVLCVGAGVETAQTLYPGPVSLGKLVVFRVMMLEIYQLGADIHT